MTKLLLRRFILFVFSISYTILSYSCTLLLASGKATPDGRPLLLKIRDSGDKDVVMRMVTSDGLSYVAQYSIKPTYLSGPWGGHNEKGFAIVNSLSKNIQNTESGALNDDVIKMALESCVTIDDFEKLLDGLEKPTQVRANFGVIDAHGHAAFYEMGQNSYVKYDANDETIAPDGIMIRTNFSMSWDEPNKNGEDRYNAALQFVEEAKEGNHFNWRYVLQTLPRYLKNDKGISLYDEAPLRYDDELKTYFGGYIVGKGNSNALLYQGVKEGESPSLMVCWSLVGLPLTTVAFPLFNIYSIALPAKVCGEEGGKAWICDRSLKLCEFVYPYKDQDATSYIDLSKLYNQEQTGIMQRIMRIEDDVLNRGEMLLEQARETGFVDRRDVVNYYEWLDSYLSSQYASSFSELAFTNILRPQNNTIIYNYWDMMGRQIRCPLNRGFFIRQDKRKMIVR